MIFLNYLFSSYDLLSVLDYVFTAILLILLNLLLYMVIKKKIAIVSVSILSFLTLIFKLFLLNSVFIVCLGITLGSGLLISFLNMNDFRVFMNKFKKEKKILIKKNFSEIDKIYDHDNLYNTINKTVCYLSERKIGALITFERRDSLVNVIKNGKILNAPVNFDLLITIFYPGTDLHDGAVVIKGNTILAAAVFYQPSTKPLPEKVGSRHRAAIGISEKCDAVTVVVSEETGRISIAYNGKLDSYNKDTFYNAFVNIMNETEIYDKYNG